MTRRLIGLRKESSNSIVAINTMHLRDYTVFCLSRSTVVNLLRSKVLHICNALCQHRCLRSYFKEKHINIWLSSIQLEFRCRSAFGGLAGFYDVWIHAHSVPHGSAGFVWQIQTLDKTILYRIHRRKASTFDFMVRGQRVYCQDQRAQTIPRKREFSNFAACICIGRRGPCNSRADEKIALAIRATERSVLPRRRRRKIQTLGF